MGLLILLVLCPVFSVDEVYGYICCKVIVVLMIIIATEGDLLLTGIGLVGIHIHRKL